MRGPWANPVLARELKERLRTRRATFVVVGYLGVLALVLRIVYAAQARDDVRGFVEPGVLATQAATLGRTLFETLVFFMLALVVLLVPGMTADAITGERERQTLVPLQVTLLRPWSIVGGKLAASLAFITFLVLATLPLLGVSFVLGGVTVAHVVAGVLAVLGTGVFLASMAIACSAHASRTQAAMVLAYAATFFLIIGSTLVYAAQDVFDDDERKPPLAALLFNPFFGTADAIAPARAEGGFTSPFEPMRTLIAEEARHDEIFVNQVRGARFGVQEPRERRIEARWFESIPFWIRSFGVLTCAGIVLFALSTRRLRTPATKGAQ